MNKIIIPGLFLVLLLSCNKKEDAQTAHDNLNSTLWMQTAAEYVANSIQTYQAAASKLKDLINDKNYTALLEQKDGYQKLPPAIILDVDETVLDNSPYQGMLIKENKDFSSDTWNHWISLKQAEAIPGVVDFLNTAQDLGVTIFYVTNRKCSADSNASDLCPQDMQTFENLEKVGIKNVTLANVLLKNEQEDWTSDKTSRREYIAQSYRVIMLFGDNLGDFLADTSKSVSERENLIYQNKERWGNSWFMLANPAYGGWQSVLDDPKDNNLKSF